MMLGSPPASVQHISRSDGESVHSCGHSCSAGRPLSMPSRCRRDDSLLLAGRMQGHRVSSWTAAQDFKLAVEEAKELQDRRDGVPPATQHAPRDLRLPPEADAEPGLWEACPGAPAEAADAQAASAEAGLALLHACALGRFPSTVGLPAGPASSLEGVAQVPCTLRTAASRLPARGSA